MFVKSKMLESSISRIVDPLVLRAGYIGQITNLFIFKSRNVQFVTWTPVATFVAAYLLLELAHRKWLTG
jgi:hypothetical protein